MHDVNEALALDDRESVLLALQNPALQLTNVDPKNITQYIRLMSKKKTQKAEESGDPDAVLWIEDIQECIDRGNLQTRQALKRKLFVGGLVFSSVCSSKSKFVVNELFDKFNKIFEMLFLKSSDTNKTIRFVF